MKLILSRKGFDSGSGGTPSPIFPDGKLVSLPIPDKQSSIQYSDLRSAGGSLGELVADLTRGKVRSDFKAHLDPDLAVENLPRPPGWRPLFGQTGPAQSHLRNHGVGPGDVFLFFGLFRPVEKQLGTWRWVPKTRPRHVIWGWMQIEKVLELGKERPTGYEWADYHPHFNRENDPYNVVYVGSDWLNVDETHANLPGTGVFRQVTPQLQLTARGAKGTSPWHLPRWFYPGEGRAPLSYHGNSERWQQTGTGVILDVVKRGQEFVLDCRDYPEAVHWAMDLIANNTLER